MSISRFAPDSGRVRILHDLGTDIGGRDVVLVEDIVDTGLTLAYLTSQLAARGPAHALDACALLDRPGAPHRPAGAATTAASSWSTIRPRLRTARPRPVPQPARTSSPATATSSSTRPTLRRRPVPTGRPDRPEAGGRVTDAGPERRSCDPPVADRCTRRGADEPAHRAPARRRAAPGSFRSSSAHPRRPRSSTRCRAWRRRGR